MRLALLSDIHGNAVALDAVLADLDRQAVDAILCLGDVATLGAQPRLVLDRLQALGCACVRGNHDDALLDLERATALHIGPPLHPTLQWCAEQLTDGDREWLRASQPTLRRPLGADADLLAFHGSPRSNVDLILAGTPPAALDEMLAGQSAAVLAGGHTHMQLLRQHHGRLLFNPGSVGCPFQTPPPSEAAPTLLPWAEYALLTWAAGAVHVDLRRVPYDLEAWIAALAASDLPLKGWWLGQYRRPAPA
ncbi:MAG: metallophosphoesterase family protein [Anaerolineales bacterium]|nr:metallophosphoesterase family protein [Anaerolineales bacterium]